VALNVDQAASQGVRLGTIWGICNRLLILAGLWVAQLCSGPPTSPMHWLGPAVQITNIALRICILVLMWRRNLLRAFPFFSSYVAYGLVAAIPRAITLSTPHVYLYVYWITEPLSVILAILAVNESFRRVFHVFYLLRWFRFVFPGGIAVALLGSVLAAFISPPRHVGLAGAMIISAMTVAQYVILAISFVFFALVLLLPVRWGIHEYHIVMGFGFSSLATVFAAAVRSVFVTRFTFFSSMLPAVVYVAVLVIWLTAMVHPLPPDLVFVGEGFSPEEVVRVLREDLANIRSLLRRR
jgi:hypothetical protein